MHGLVKEGWQFKIDEAKRRGGLCSFKNKTISVSRHLIERNNEPATIDVLLHEIAHALVGPMHGHNGIWRHRAMSIGCNGKRCHNHDMPEGKYLGMCPSCRKERRGHRRNRVACGQCCRKYNGGKFTHEYLLVWSAAKLVGNKK